VRQIKIKNGGTMAKEILNLLKNVPEKIGFVVVEKNYVTPDELAQGDLIFIEILV